MTNSNRGRKLAFSPCTFVSVMRHVASVSPSVLSSKTGGAEEVSGTRRKAVNVSRVWVRRQWISERKTILFDGGKLGSHLKINRKEMPSFSENHRWRFVVVFRHSWLKKRFSLPSSPLFVRQCHRYAYLGIATFASESIHLFIRAFFPSLLRRVLGYLSPGEIFHGRASDIPISNVMLAGNAVWTWVKSHTDVVIKCLSRFTSLLRILCTRFYHPPLQQFYYFLAPTKSRSILRAALSHTFLL